MTGFLVVLLLQEGNVDRIKINSSFGIYNYTRKDTIKKKLHDYNQTNQSTYALNAYLQN